MKTHLIVHAPEVFFLNSTTSGRIKSEYLKANNINYIQESIKLNINKTKKEQNKQPNLMFFFSSLFFWS